MHSNLKRFVPLRVPFNVVLMIKDKNPMFRFFNCLSSYRFDQL